MELQSSERSHSGEMLKYRIVWDTGFVELSSEVIAEHKEFEQLFDVLEPSLACLDVGPGCPCLAQILLYFLLERHYSDRSNFECYCDMDERERKGFHRFVRALEIYRRAMVWKLPALSYLATEAFAKEAKSLKFAEIIQHLSSETWIFGNSDEHYALAELIADRAGHIGDGELEEKGLTAEIDIWGASSHVSDRLVAGLLMQRERIKALLRHIQSLAEDEEGSEDEEG
ncbi:hypothetical protein FSPOR_8733 [Fusarium sporotrichioides]|uniref:Uncharacterized protein n=1 Tax=Fusarium sporotrichioides TaxID=5514 RepID=A0A395RT29_FUSSP|nr:hypothetical protein FSPOR_8733 [Fusarium sporotrichioides]